jgi:Zn-dependent protease
MKALLLLLFAGLKSAKVGTTGLSMLVSLAVYAGLWGWRYAAGFIVCLLVHEIGHVIAAQQRGLAISAPAFIPFMGAFITMRDAPPNVETEAHVAIGGPLLGSVAAFGFYFAGDWGDNRLLLAIAYSAFVLNLFNLLPVSPLDGGRIVAVLGPRIWFIGVPVLIAMFVYRPSPVLLIVGLLALPQLLRALRYRPGFGTTDYYAIPAQKKIEYGAMYLGLVVALSIMAFEVHNDLRSVG